MKVDSNQNFDKTLNLPSKTINVNAKFLKDHMYLLEKMQDPKKYKAALNQNSNTNKHYDITDMPMNISENIEVTEIINKVLKDIFIRNKVMNGNVVNYSIFFSNTNNLLQDIKEVEENENEKQIKKKKKIFVFANVRERERANQIVKARIFTKKKLEEKQKYQIMQINRLGMVQDHSKNFSSTLKPEFEALMLDKFLSLYNDGKIYKENKPVYWCEKCKSSYSHAKYEYDNKKLAYVMYRVKDDHYLFAKYSNLRNTYFIGTTIDPWIMVNSNYLVIIPEQKYVLIEVNTDFAQNHYIIAKEVLSNVLKTCGIKEYKVLEEIDGEQLKWCQCQDPLDYTKSIGIIGAKDEYVMPDKKNSTGIRILSNCHSYIDYLIYTENRLDDEMKNMLDMKLMTSSNSNGFKNMYYKDAEKSVLEYLEKGMFLLNLKNEKIKVPKCECCNQNLVYRFVNEWYLKKDEKQKISQKALENVKEKIVENKYFNKEKISEYLEKIYKKDSVQISEEKLFGVPIPVFYCGECGKVVLNSSTIERIKKIFKNRKTEEWYKMTPEDILHREVRCDYCSCDFFFKEEAVFNDFFKLIAEQLTVESEDDIKGLSEDNNIIIEPKDRIVNKLKSLSFDNNIESEIEKIGKILVHGQSHSTENNLKIETFKNLKKQKSESIQEESQNNFDINNIVNEYGMDILRMWCAHKYSSSKISLKKEEVEKEKYVYNFLRLTFKYLLSNLKEFNPNQDYIKLEDRTDLDKYVYMKLSKLHSVVIKSYDEMKFNEVYDAIVEFCKNFLCKTYFDSLKYRLYILDLNDKVRISTLSTMYDILMTLIFFLEPVIPFLIEEILPYVWFREKFVEKNILLLRNKFVRVEEEYKEEYEKWERIFSFKYKMKKVLGKAQKNKIIGNTLDAKIIIHTNPKTKEFIDKNYDDIIRAINVSNIVIEITEKPGVKVEKAEGTRCARCKNYAIDIGKNIKYRYLCPNCASILENRK